MCNICFRTNRLIRSQQRILFIKGKVIKIPIILNKSFNIGCENLLIDHFPLHTDYPLTLGINLNKIVATPHKRVRPDKILSKAPHHNKSPGPSPGILLHLLSRHLIQFLKIIELIFPPSPNIRIIAFGSDPAPSVSPPSVPLTPLFSLVALGEY